MTLPDTRSAARRTNRQRATRKKAYAIVILCVVVVISVATTLAITRPWTNKLIHPIQSVNYLGIYQPDAPLTYASVNKFAQAIGRQPNLVSYYSPWREPFESKFATSAERHGAVTVVQIDPKNVSLSSIAAGHYDAYLRAYAAAVKTFGGK